MRVEWNEVGRRYKDGGGPDGVRGVQGKGTGILLLCLPATLQSTKDWGATMARRKRESRVEEENADLIANSTLVSYVHLRRIRAPSTQL